MLLELHVKNLALIEKADLEFYDGLNVLSGETGAGKSILIDSINLVLGAKASKDTIRTGAEYAYIEAVFSIRDDMIEQLKSLEIYPDDNNLIIISRKLMPGRSISKINDETVTSQRLKAVSAMLIDIHGQNEHQSLLSQSKQLEFLDLYLPDNAKSIKDSIKALYKEYNDIEDKLSSTGDEAMRAREKDILSFEIEEIETAALKAGEEEELNNRYRKYKNSAKISEALSGAVALLDDENVSKAIRLLSDISSLDDGAKNLYEQLIELDNLYSDIIRDIAEYSSQLDFDDATFASLEERLDIVHRLQDKYTDNIDEILALCEKKKERLERLENFDEYYDKLQKRKKEIKEELELKCSELTKLRALAAKKLEERIEAELDELNFMQHSFKIDIKRKAAYSQTGLDDICFMISTNAGEPLKALAAVASGGELSRIMLALKSVLADHDKIETLIFDEIDTGISGITAQRVAEKLSYIGKKHQVLCITHLAQIAAMAEHNYLISKSAEGGRTYTKVTRLDEDEAVAELARMIGGSKLTDSVYDTARQMRALAKK